MVQREIIEAQLPHTIKTIEAPRLGKRYGGKVRDCFTQGDRRVLVTSDRLSAFDRVLTTIPFKGQVLNEMAAFWFEKTAHIVPNHVISRPHPNVFVAREVEILPVEMVIRGYLTGSAWRDYQAGKAVSGIELPKGMRRSQRFDTPLITPSTKEDGPGKHDMPISSQEIINSGMVEKKLWEQICEKALALFAFGSECAAKQGLILVDTKYEFGILRTGGAPQVVLADEIHTQDSSRYWIAQSYQTRFEEGKDPEMLDKEFVRRWLIEQGYMGDGEPPVFSDSFRVDTAIKYIEACERITGFPFKPLAGPQSDAIQRVLAEL